MNGQSSFPPVAPTEDRYVSLAELTKYSSLSRRTLLLYLDDPDYPLPHYRFGRRIAVRLSEFDEWAKRFRSTATLEVSDAIARQVNVSIYCDTNEVKAYKSAKRSGDTGKMLELEQLAAARRARH